GVAAVLVIGGLAAMLMLGRATPPAGAVSANGGSPAAATGAPAPAATNTKAPAPAAATSDGASLKVETEPAGAMIILDGRDSKQATPATVTLRGAGPHRLQLTKRGFVSKDVRLADEDVRSGAISYTLEE